MNKMMRTEVVFLRLVAVFMAAFLFGLLGGCGRETPDGAAAPDTDATRTAVSGKNHEATIAAVGDSLTFGEGVAESGTYPAQLEKRLAAEGFLFRVVNSGISGETSSGTLSRIQWILKSLKPDMVILTIGANDGLRGIDPDVLRENLDRLVAGLKANRIPVLLGGMRMLPNLGPEYVAEFERIYSEIAQKHDVLLMPFFLEGVAGNPRLNQPDGIHPTAEGYQKIVENLYPYVVRLIAQYRKAK